MRLRATSRGIESNVDGRLVRAGDQLFFGAGGELWAVPLECPWPVFHRADPNSSGTTDISDALSIFGYLFLGSNAPTCLESADVNNSGGIDISDGIGVLNWLFASGAVPAAPGPLPSACGPDTDPPGSPGDLGCFDYPPCQ